MVFLVVTPLFRYFRDKYWDLSRSNITSLLLLFLRANILHVVVILHQLVFLLEWIIVSDVIFFFKFILLLEWIMVHMSLFVVEFVFLLEWVAFTQHMLLLETIFLLRFGFRTSVIRCVDVCGRFVSIPQAWHAAMTIHGIPKTLDTLPSQPIVMIDC